MDFLRAHALQTFLAADGVWMLFVFFERSLDLPPALAFTGLGGSVPPSLDFIPLFPWQAPFLLGMALAQWRHPSQFKPAWRSSPGRYLTLPGQHSLLVYLLHQPLLIAAIAAFTWVAG